MLINFLSKSQTNLSPFHWLLVIKSSLGLKLLLWFSALILQILILFFYVSSKATPSLNQKNHIISQTDSLPQTNLNPIKTTLITTHHFPFTKIADLKLLGILKTSNQFIGFIQSPSKNMPIEIRTQEHIGTKKWLIKKIEPTQITLSHLLHNQEASLEWPVAPFKKVISNEY